MAMTKGEKYCYDCIHNEVCQWQPREYCDFKENAQPVKHGKWIEKKVCRMKWIPYDDDDVNPDDVDIECMTEQKCSYCKRWTIKFTYQIELDYCPLCGARMDGDSDE